eukprot:255661-Pelagomonas_calceolata.AAC.1
MPYLLATIPDECAGLWYAENLLATIPDECAGLDRADAPGRRRSGRDPYRWTQQARARRREQSGSRGQGRRP